MNRIKSVLVTIYILGIVIVGPMSVCGMVSHNFRGSWIAAVIATLPSFILIASVFARRLARTSANLPIQLLSAAVGAALLPALAPSGKWPVIITIGWGLIGTPLYVFWYSRLGRRVDRHLSPGEVLPDFFVTDISGRIVASSEIRRSAALLLFFRGNWCPLCMVQIREIAEQYRELAARGVQVYLVGSQSEQQTAELARKYDVPMHFMADPDAQAARALGILHENGVPFGNFGYESDTAMPTAILSDAKGKIIWADLTDNYRVRPEPGIFLDMFDRHTQVPQTVVAED